MLALSAFPTFSLYAWTYGVRVNLDSEGQPHGVEEPGSDDDPDHVPPVLLPSPEEGQDESEKAESGDDGQRDGWGVAQVYR